MIKYAIVMAVFGVICMIVSLLTPKLAVKVLFAGAGLLGWFMAAAIIITDTILHFLKKF